jgi:periplasmic protein TonB
MFTKFILPFGNAYFLQSDLTQPLVGNPYGLKKACNQTTWYVLALVIFAHLALVVAPRSQPQPVAPEIPPKPILVTMVSEQSTVNSAPSLSSPPKQVIEKLVKPKTKAIKPKKAVFKPVETAKPVIEREQKTQSFTPEKTSTPPSKAEAPSDATQYAPEKSKPEAAGTKYQAPSFNAGYLHNPPPSYPSVSRRMGEQGRVLLNVTVSAEGGALSVALHASSGSNRLDEAAIAAIRKWRFVPAKRGGQAVSASVIVPIKFSLEG